MPDHRFALSAEVHEPKHITSTTTADAGKVITPSGTTSGTSELRQLASTDLSDIGTLIQDFAYGEIAVDANTTSFSITAAGDTSLNTAGDYILLNSARITGTQDELFNMTFQGVDNALVIEHDGVFKIGGWFNVQSDTNATKIGIRYSLNGTPVGGILKTDIKDLGRVQNLSGFGLTTLASGDVIGMAIAADKTCNLTINDLRLNLELVREI